MLNKVFLKTNKLIYSSRMYKNREISIEEKKSVLLIHRFCEVCPLNCDFRSSSTWPPLYYSALTQCRLLYTVIRSIPVAARSKAWVCRLSLVGIVVYNPFGECGCPSVANGMCCTGRGLCVGLITRPEESYGA